MAIEAHSSYSNLGFSGMENQDMFNHQQKQHHQLHQMQHVSAFKTINNDRSFLSTIIERQRQEIDQYVNLQSERLRLALQEQRKQQFTTLIQKIEAKSLALLKQKDEEIARESNRAMELEIFLRKLEMENHAWQRLANENESIVINLQNEIEQLKNQPLFNNWAEEDAESCCDLEKTGENRGGKLVCKGCNSGDSRVLFLPCRDLCSCLACDAFLNHCPVCKMVKKGSIEISFS